MRYRMNILRIRTFLFVFLIIFALFPAGVITAQTQYYVSAENGNDAWNGLASSYTSGINGPKQTIQAAIDAAGAGDVINVHLGTYTEDLNIPAGKDNLEIKSVYGVVSRIKGIQNVPVASAPLVDPNIEIRSPGVKIHGFTIDGPDYAAGKYSSGIVVGAADVEICDNVFNVPGGESANEISRAIQTYGKATVPGVDISGLNIHDNRFNSLDAGPAGYEGIYISLDAGGTAVTVSENIFRNNIYRAVTTERSYTDVTLNTVTTSMAAWSGAAGSLEAFFVGGSSDEAMTAVDISQNTIDGSAGDKGFARCAMIGGVSQTGLTNITVSNNIFGNSAVGILVQKFPAGITIDYNDLSDVVTGVQNDVTGTPVDARKNWWGDTDPSDDISGDVNYVPMLANGIDADSAPGFQKDTPGAYYTSTSIQDAINGAAAGDTINVAAGTYAESLTINKHVVLIGKKSDRTEAWTVEEPGADSGPEITFDGSNGYMSLISADNVTIRGFTLNLTGAVHTGVFFSGEVDSTTIQYCTFEMDDDPSGDRGIVIENFSVVSGLDVDHCRFSGIQSSVAGNTDWFYISNSNDAVPGDGGSVDGAVLSNNYVVESTAELRLDGSIADVTFSRNDFNNSNGYIVLREIESQSNNKFSLINVTGNVFRNRTEPFPDEFAVLVSSDVDDIDVQTNWQTDLILRENLFLQDNAGGANPAVGFQSTAGKNSSIDARYNYWGYAGGPTSPTNPDSLGATVSGRLLYDPWYADAELTEQGTHNFAPVLEAVPDTVINETDTLTFTVRASDANGDSLVYSVLDIPSGAVFDSVSGDFEWTPSYDQSGVYEPVFIATDDGVLNLADSMTVTITILNVNRPPVMAILPDTTISENDTLALTIQAHDPDADSLNFRAIELPEGASLDSTNGEFLWIPTFEQAGICTTMFIVSDYSIPVYSDSQSMIIEVINMNRPPVLDAIDDKVVTDMDTLSFIVTGSDPDSDAVEFSAAGLPDGAVFDTATGQFTWMPGFSQIGTHVITLYLSDGAAVDSAAVNITVLRFSEAPVIITTGLDIASEGFFYTDTIFAMDSDARDTLLFSMITGPAWLSIDSTGILTGTASIDDAGRYLPVEVYVVDPSGLSDTLSTHLYVNDTPEFAPASFPDAIEDEPYSFMVHVRDNDKNDTFAFSVETGPAWIHVTDVDSLCVISGTPSDYDTGTDIPVMIAVVDSGGLRDSLYADINIINVNDAPEFVTTFVKYALEDSPYRDTLTVHDPDPGDSWSFGILKGPEWLSMTSSDTTCFLAGTPGNDDVGSEIPVVVRVTDAAGASDTLSTVFGVSDVNDKPVIVSYSPSTSMTVTEGDSVVFSVIIEDIDTKTLYCTWFDNEIPVAYGMTNDSLFTETLIFTYGSAGFHTISINILDAQHIVTQEWNITVREKIVQPEEPVTMTLTSDTASVRVSFSNNSSIACTFTSGSVAHCCLSVTQYTDISQPFAHVPPFDNPAGYFGISTNAEDFTAEVTFGYSDATLSAANITEDDLAVSYFDSVDSRGYIWHSVPVNLDKAANTVTITTGHFSLWALTSKDEQLITSVSDNDGNAPDAFRLYQNYPNPFNASTTISYYLPVPGMVSVRIYNVLGQEVRTLVDEMKAGGRHFIKWDGADNNGIAAASGIYIIRIYANGSARFKKAVLLK